MCGLYFEVETRKEGGREIKGRMERMKRERTVKVRNRQKKIKTVL